MAWGTAAAAAPPPVAWATEEGEAQPAPDSFPVLGANVNAFPTLGVAVKVKKTKKQAMSLADFNASATPSTPGSGGYRAPGSSGRGLPDDTFLVLPTGPRAREDGEEDSRPGLGGAFRDYGGDRGGGERESKYGASAPVRASASRTRLRRRSAARRLAADWFSERLAGGRRML